jgi:hypothetical protein
MAAAAPVSRRWWLSRPGMGALRDWPGAHGGPGKHLWTAGIATRRSAGVPNQQDEHGVSMTQRDNPGSRRSARPRSIADYYGDLLEFLNDRQRLWAGFIDWSKAITTVGDPAEAKLPISLRLTSAS